MDESEKNCTVTGQESCTRRSEVLFELYVCMYVCKCSFPKYSRTVMTRGAIVCGYGWKQECQGYI